MKIRCWNPSRLFCPQGVFRSIVQTWKIFLPREGFSWLTQSHVHIHVHKRYIYGFCTHRSRIELTRKISREPSMHTYFSIYIYVCTFSSLSSPFRATLYRGNPLWDGRKKWSIYVESRAQLGKYFSYSSRRFFLNFLVSMYIKIRIIMVNTQTGVTFVISALGTWPRTTFWHSELHSHISIYNLYTRMYRCIYFSTLHICVNKCTWVSDQRALLRTLVTIVVLMHAGQLLHQLRKTSTSTTIFRSRC